jgi:ABC-type dipeptide/oligopeptide/nickel transport system permease component
MTRPSVISKFAYLIRRLLYAIPILIGVNLLTFTLFFVVNTPQNMARSHLGEKYVTQDAIDHWMAEKGYDKKQATDQIGKHGLFTPALHLGNHRSW